MEKRATQKEVAKKAGVHSSTVSLAFKNHHSIPEATRQRIKEAAAEVGYFPDPMLAALAAFNCPALARGGNPKDDIRCYAVNTDFFMYPPSGKPQPISSVKTPSSTYCLVEVLKAVNTAPLPGKPHNSQNYFFFDGHLEARPLP